MDPTDMAMSVFATAFSVETVGLLARKGLISTTESSEIFDRVLLNLETQTATASPAQAPVLALARGICELALARLAEQNRNPR